MTDQEILTLAREAGFVMEGDLRGAGRLPELLGQFARLIAAREREACAQICEDDEIAHWECADAIRKRGET